MTLEQYWAILVKQWRLILICFLCVGVGAYIASKLIAPLYQATALIQVVVRSSNDQSDINNLLASDQLVQTEVRLAISYPVLHEVVTHYKDLTVDQLSKRVTSTDVLNTQLFEITVQDPSPPRAAALANDVATTLIKQQKLVLQEDYEQSKQQLQQSLNDLGQQIDAVTKQELALQAQRASQAQVAVLQTRLNSLLQQYDQLQGVLAQLELTEAQKGNLLRVAQPAQAGPSPVYPNVLLNTGMGFLVGLFLGMLLAVLFTVLDTRIRTSDALIKLLGFPLLATIWLERLTGQEENTQLIVEGGNIESFRILRTNIEFSTINRAIRSLAVVSALPHEGKSLIAINLATFIAKTGKRTLLIDGDLRHPSLHNHFGLSRSQAGLSNAILALSGAKSDDVSLTHFIHSASTPNLWVMPSGPLPPNPPELLAAKAMQHLFTVIANDGFETVIVDTPPFLGLSDASILTSMVDSTLVVVDITRASRERLTQMHTQLAQVGASVLGCVVNKQRRTRKDIVYSYDSDEYEDTEGQSMKSNSAAVVLPNLLNTVGKVPTPDSRRAEQGSLEE